MLLLVHRMFRAVAPALVLLAPPAASAQVVYTTLHSGSGRSFGAYLAGPSNATAGIVLVHDWFGVTPFFLEAIARLGRQGYRVAGVDLYDGRSAVSHDEASALMRGLDAGVAAGEIDAAVQSLRVGGRRVALMGFSMGARPALEAALRTPSIVATVVWYGETVNDPQRLKRLGGPALLVVGSRDGPSAAQNAAAFSRAADDAGVAAEVYVYPGAEHAFAQPLFNAGTTYDAAATEVAWQLTESFLRRRLRLDAGAGHTSVDARSRVTRGRLPER